MHAAPHPAIRVLPHVRRALDAGAAVVALESSVIAQGLPIPHNATAVRRVLAAVEAAGAVAAITAVVAGVVTLGLEPSELQRFLDREGIRKVSTRDLAPAITDGADGATTVAASLAIASRGGARVFATGGIGGVHRLPRGAPAGAARDESADLLELSRTPMVVVCAGAKSILDLPATWERLDTLGIPVVGYRTREFPAFYSTTSGLPLTVTADDPAQVASIAANHFRLGLQQSILVVQAPPAGVALDAASVGEAIDVALAEAARQRVTGAAVTPHLLAAVSRMTGGRSLDTNLGLLESNARLAADIAVAMARPGGSTT